MIAFVTLGPRIRANDGLHCYSIEDAIRTWKSMIVVIVLQLGCSVSVLD